MTQPSIRPATLADAPVLARLVNFAGEGLPLYLWKTRHGYAKAAARPMVKDGWENDGRKWILLTKALAVASCAGGE